MQGIAQEIEQLFAPLTNLSSIQQQKEHQFPRKHLMLAKADGRKNVKIKGNKLFVDEIIYEIEDLRKVEETENQPEIPRKRNSAPSTPSRPDCITQTQEEEEEQ